MEYNNNNTEKGKCAEDFAAEYLINKGYVILERNWRHKHYEVDIIAEKNDVLVVVEVKFRSYNTYGEPEVFVNKQKQKYLTEAINAYIQQKDIDKEVRFDIVAVGFKNKNFQVHHIEDAFYAR